MTELPVEQVIRTDSHSIGIAKSPKLHTHTITIFINGLTSASTHWTPFGHPGSACNGHPHRQQW